LNHGGRRKQHAPRLKCPGSFHVHTSPGNQAASFQGVFQTTIQFSAHCAENRMSRTHRGYTFTSSIFKFSSSGLLSRNRPRFIGLGFWVFQLFSIVLGKNRVPCRSLLHIFPIKNIFLAPKKIRSQPESKHSTNTNLKNNNPLNNPIRHLLQTHPEVLPEPLTPDHCTETSHRKWDSGQESVEFARTVQGEGRT
jgi:hypothetical protein